MQLTAKRLLVEDVYGVRPPYGVLVLADGVQQRVVNSRDLEQRVLAAIAQMREAWRSICNRAHAGSVRSAARAGSTRRVGADVPRSAQHALALAERKHPSIDAINARPKTTSGHARRVPTTRQESPASD